LDTTADKKVPGKIELIHISGHFERLSQQIWPFADTFAIVPESPTRKQSGRAKTASGQEDPLLMLYKKALLSWR
jgi:hypothetical protein